MAIIEPKQVTLKNGRQVCIRNRTNEDVDNVFKCFEAIFADDHFFVTTIDEIRENFSAEKYVERTKLFNEHEQKLLLVVEADGQIISISDIECGERKRSRHVGQLGLSILSAYRRLGLGTAVMQTLIDWAVSHPVIEKLSLGVWAKNEPAIRLYEKMGFVEEGRKVREVKYADGSYDDCVCMYRFVKQGNGEIG